MTAIAPLRVSFKEIMLATDLSEDSGNTLSYAKAIARRFDSRILLVHVDHSTNPILIPEGEWFEDQPAIQTEKQVEAAAIALRV